MFFVCPYKSKSGIFTPLRKTIRKIANFSKFIIIFAAIKQSDAHPSIMNKKSYTPFVATHPGEMLKDELKERGISQKQLAEQTGIKPSVISEMSTANAAYRLMSPLR